MRSPRRGFDALLFLGGCVVALGLGELGLRTFWPQHSDATLGMFEQDPDAGYRLRGSYRNEIRVPEYRTAVCTDAEGYRIAEDAPRHRDGDVRMLAIGDSFTFGVGVNAEDAFPAVLERRLDEGGHVEWQVRNGGVGGYGPLRTAHALMSRQGNWRPEIVVHAIYVGNDLEDSDPDHFRTSPVVRDGRMVTPGRHPFVQARMFLRTRSHLYAFLRQHLYGLYRASGLWQRSQYLDPIGLAEWPQRVTDVTWPAGQQAVQDVRDWAAERGVRYLVVVIPARWQVDDGAWERYRHAWGREVDAFDRDHAQREVMAALARMDVPALNLLPVLRRAQANGVAGYYSLDPHWTAQGHAIAAETILLKLQALGWVGPEGHPRRARAQTPAADVTG